MIAKKLGISFVIAVVLIGCMIALFSLIAMYPLAVVPVCFGVAWWVSYKLVSFREG